MHEHSTTAGRRLVAALLVAGILVALASRAMAADIACPRGTRVVMGGTAGEVAELGTRAPHAGWARIVTAASPGGEWIDWRHVDVRAAGSGARCSASARNDDSAVRFGPPVVDDDDPPAASPTPPGN